MDEIQKIYIALFGRPADPLGLSFWMQQTRAGADLASFDGMTGTAEYLARFEGQTHAEIVGAIYEALFNRVADEDGLRFFVEELEAGNQTLSTIAIAIAQGAQNDDASIIANKIVAANLFTAALQAEGDTAKYSGEAAAELARLFLDSVTANPNSLPGADDAKHALDPKPPVPPQPQPQPEPDPVPVHSLTLTTGQDYATSRVAYLNGPTLTDDAFRFSAGNETVTATHLTMGVGDVLTDGSTDDRDVLNIHADRNTLNWVRDALITNIEVLNAHVTSPTNDDALNLQNFRGLKEFILHAEYALTATIQDYIYVHNFASSGVTRIDYSNIGAGVNGQDYMYAEDRVAHQSITFVGHGGGDVVAIGNGNNVINTFASTDIIVVGNGNNLIDTGDDWDFVTAGGGSNVISTGSGVDEIRVGAAGSTGMNLITPGTLGDRIFLNGSGPDTIEIARYDTGLLLDGDQITGFQTGIDKLKFVDLPVVTSTSYVENTTTTGDYFSAIGSANGAFAASGGALNYYFIADPTYGFLFMDDDASGSADRVIVLIGLDASEFGSGDIV